MDPDGTPPSDQQPPVFNYVLSFILVGLAWGFTTPFIRRAAVEFNARQEEAARKQQTQMQSTGESYRDDDDDSGDDNDNNNERARVGRRHTTTPAARPSQSPSPSPSQSFLLAKLTSLFWTVINLLRTPGYAIPLVLNLTGSVWFFLLVGKHELSLTVPITNSMAFLFTVLGEWYVERKVISGRTWVGMVLVLGGIALCVESKNNH